MKKHVGLGAALLFLSGVSGCGGDDSGGSDGPTGVSVSGTTVLAGLGIALGGVEVCAPDLPAVKCVTSAGDGAYALEGIPKNQRVVLTAEKAEFAKALGYFDIGSVDVEATVGMQELKVVKSSLDPVGVVFDETKASIGILVLGADDKGLSDWTAAIDPAATPEQGPWFGGDTGLKFDPAAKKTTASGSIAFVNLPAGSATVTLTGTGTCQKDAFTVSSGEKVWETELRSGYLTYHLVHCPP